MGWAEGTTEPFRSIDRGATQPRKPASPGSFCKWNRYTHQSTEPLQSIQRKCTPPLSINRLAPNSFLRAFAPQPPPERAPLRSKRAAVPSFEAWMDAPCQAQRSPTLIDRSNHPLCLPESESTGGSILTNPIRPQSNPKPTGPINRSIFASSSIQSQSDAASPAAGRDDGGSAAGGEHGGGVGGFSGGRDLGVQAGAWFFGSVM